MQGTRNHNESPTLDDHPSGFQGVQAQTRSRSTTSESGDRFPRMFAGDAPTTIAPTENEALHASAAPVKRPKVRMVTNPKMPSKFSRQEVGGMVLPHMVSVRVGGA